MENDDWNKLTARANHLGLGYYDMLLQLARTGYHRKNLMADYDVVKAYSEFPQQLQWRKTTSSQAVQY